MGRKQRESCLLHQKLRQGPDRKDLGSGVRGVLGEFNKKGQGIAYIILLKFRGNLSQGSSPRYIDPKDSRSIFQTLSLVCNVNIHFEAFIYNIYRSDSLHQVKVLLYHSFSRGSRGSWPKRSGLDEDARVCHPSHSVDWDGFWLQPSRLGYNSQLYYSTALRTWAGQVM